MIQALIGRQPKYVVMNGLRVTSEEMRSVRASARGGRDRQFADRIKAVVLLGTGRTLREHEGKEDPMCSMEGGHPRHNAVATYCPNLNRMERLWRHLRKEVLYNRYYEHFAQFQAACQGFLEAIGARAPALRRLLTENSQIITA